jgi:hypothetical protein
MQRRHGPPRSWQPALLALFALLIVLARWHTFDEPLEPDIVTYSTIGRELVHGERLYVDVWDVKPPGLYVTFAIAELLVGHGAPAVFFLTVLASLITLGGVWVAGSALGARGGSWSAAFWVVVSGAMMIQANQPNAEVFINACVVWAFALLLKRPARDGIWLGMFAVGGLIALASSFKQVPVFLGGLLMLAHCVSPPAGVSRKTAFVDACLVGLTGAAFWLAVFGYAAATGQASTYWAAVIEANQGRGGDVLFNLYRYVREGKFLPAMVFFLIPAMIVIAVACVRGLRRGPRREWLLLLGYVVGAHVMILTQGRAFHAHSYQFWLPPLAIGLGWVAATPWLAARTGARPLERFAGDALAGVALLWALFHELPNYALSPVEWAERKYSARVVQDRQYSEQLGKLLRPNESVFLYGNGAAVYYYTEHRPSTITLWSMHVLTSDPLAKRLTQRTLEQLKANVPDVFVVQFPKVDLEPAPKPLGAAARLLGVSDVVEYQPYDQHPVYRWAMQNYRPWPDAKSFSGWTDTVLYVRAGSELERRLAR